MIIDKTYLKPFLNIEEGTNDYDLLLNNIISAVSKDIVRICNQEIESSTQTWEFCGNGKYYLIIPKFPVISITTLKYRNTNLDAWSAAIASTGYALINNSEQPILYYSDSFIAGTYNYQLIYVSGYATIPDDIKIVAAEMAMIYFKNSDIKNAGRLGIQTLGQNFGGAASTNTSYKDLTKDWERRLSKYRRRTI